MARHGTSVPVSRQLSAWERAVVERLITFAPTEEQAALIAQLDGLLVTRQCGCGCRTIEFSSVGGSGLVLDGVSDDSDQMLISFLLHIGDGTANALEMYRGDLGPLRQPPAPHLIDRVEWDDLGGGRGAVMRRIPTP
jgi:hypothetical protein